MAEWLNTTRESQWQRGCNAGRAGKPYIPPNRGGDPLGDDNRSFYNGWCFGTRQARREAAAGKRPLPTADELRQWAIELGTPARGVSTDGGTSQ